MTPYGENMDDLEINLIKNLGGNALYRDQLI